MNRRDFLKTSAVTGGSMLVAPRSLVGEQPAGIEAASATRAGRGELPDLAPARWIWFPSERTLQNTFVLFRRELDLAARPRRASGWIYADSRYRLEVNGRRVQWGPAPCDPRWAEADPIDLTEALAAGRNTLGATVLFYGAGDGTWPIGKPGFLFWLEIEHADGKVERVVSDEKWLVKLCRAWSPGHYKRWYLRALQEEFDARLYPEGWATNGFVPGQDWLPAMALPGSAAKPAISTGYYEYMLDVGGGPPDAELRPRRIPLMRESWVAVKKLSEAHTIKWRNSPRDYFDFRIPGSFEAQPLRAPDEVNPGEWEIRLEEAAGVALTFELEEQVVGWPGFTVEAPAGTTIELLVHEAHSSKGPALLNTHFDSWTRFTCREGLNTFETFDFESLRWLQLHVHGAAARVRVRQVGVRRRVFPWPNEPVFRTSEAALQRLFSASLNTLNNSAQETLVDGMARERQQYSGDGGHQMHAVHLAFGEARLVERYLATFSQGMTKDGYFLDCWPAYDRLARLIERQLDLSGWGPILDHGVGFNFDCWHHYMYTGNLDALREPYPRLVRFARYLQGLVRRDGLLPVEELGIPSVWIDHVAYRQQREKTCAFNLYAAAAMTQALAPLCEAFGDKRQAEQVRQFGAELLRVAVRTFWSARHGAFVNNLPWLAEEKAPRYCDRSLATSVLYDQCPGGEVGQAIRLLAECPPEMGFSYPCNAGWRLWALAKGGRADVVVADLRRRWAPMTSVLENNTLQEDWDARHDSGQQWSHCAVAPLYITHHGLMGLRPLEPGFARYELRPQLADLPDLDVVAHTRIGPIRLTATGQAGARELELQTPGTGRAELLLDAREVVALTPAAGVAPAGWRRYQLGAGRKVTLQLKHT